MFSGKMAQTWEVMTEGTYGDFNTPAGKICYLMTKAKLGRDTTKESTLTKYLAPVREVLNVEEMDFNQLLQRDLDDYRVATDLIDYLLKPEANGPSFYTPILAALLPFDGAEPTEYYPEITTEAAPFTDSDGIPWQETQYGNAFRLLRLAADESGSSLSRIKLGRLEFNTAMNKLVVIDGQHRAMALLAIRRTVDKEWDSTKGNRYRFFYEKRVNELLNNHNHQVDLMSIEFPVCICWFPGLSSQTTPLSSPHQAARKLFVDVNQNAKKPSVSRLILLSDTTLVPIFVRALLNELRKPGAPFPLHTIEYDYPRDQGESAPVRPLALANIVMLNNAVKLAILGPDKYIKNVDQKIGVGRTSRADEDSRLRRELEVKSWLTQEIEDEGISESITFEREELGNETFPKGKVDALVAKFMEVWGYAILKILSEFCLYSFHIEVLKSVEENWTVAAAHGELAKDAMFRGLGIYWTLKTDYEQWLENNTILRQQGKAPHDKTESGRAWEAVQEKEKEFMIARAKKLHRKNTLTEEDSFFRSTENTYSTLRTQAFLSGAVLTLASLKQELKYDAVTFKERVKFFIKSWNTRLLAKPMLFQFLFDRKQSNAFIKFNKLDSPYSVYFRYLLLELMAGAEDENLSEEERSVVQILVTKARYLYLKELISQHAKVIRRADPGINKTELEHEATSQAERELRIACNKWFGISKDEYNTWLNSVYSSSSESESEATTLDEENDETIDENDETVEDDYISDIDLGM